MQRLKWTYLGLAVFLGFPALGQQEQEMDPVTVTATLNPLQVSRTGRNIVIIKGEQYARLPVNSVDELLRYVPGVEVQARGPMGVQSDIVLRGGTFQQVLVILDGVRLNDPVTGHFNSYIPIAPAEIDRIEVLKGGSSAVYGSDAVGGVIHIITKSFSAVPYVTKKEVTAQVAGGEYNLRNAHAGGYWSNGYTSVGAGVLSNNTDGQPGRGVRNDFHLHTASLSVSHRVNNWQFALRSAYDQRRFGAQNFYTNLVLDTAREEVTTLWNQLQASYQKGRDAVKLTLGYKNGDDAFTLRPSGATNNNASRLVQALLTWDRRLGSHTRLVTGGQFQQRSIRSNDRGNHKVAQAAGFLILNQSAGKLQLNPALRFDWHELGGAELVPQLDLSYRLQEFSLRGSVGKTIRYADFTEQYNNYNKPPFVGSGNRIGNPELQAERSLHAEAGYDLFVSNHLKLSQTFFLRKHRDLIDYVSTPYAEMPRPVNLAPGGTFLLARNIGEVTTRGLETDLQYARKLPGKAQVFGTLGLVWLKSLSGNGVPSLYISNHAKMLVNFLLQYSNPYFSVSTSGLYKKRATAVTPNTPSAVKATLSPDYFVLNAKAEGFLVKEKLSLFVQVDNLLDRSYSDLLGAQMPGRWLMGGIKITLQKTGHADIAATRH
ncbi:MAG TPA: TonB-dependent receptor [Chitinophagaceae bacterium]|jgi:iron complex outermembrane receptor protein|nr:TonB-dependent receptor [Chitinophagaceae bacterium]